MVVVKKSALLDEIVGECSEGECELNGNQYYHNGSNLHLHLINTPTPSLYAIKLSSITLLPPSNSSTTHGGFSHLQSQSNVKE